MFNLFVQTIAPILILMSAGILSRRLNILKAGDEKVLSAYVYYFALPALFLVNIAEIRFTSEILAFMLVGTLPIGIVLAIYVSLYFLFHIPQNTLYLLIVTTIFGSLAFFGIPFITFAFPEGGSGERLATLAAASIALVSVTISLTALELYRLETSTKWKGLKKVLKRLSRNPLVISIALGILLSLIRVEIFAPISNALHMLGSTTSVVAVFMLGVFLYGRKYANIKTALKLSLLRAVFLPTVALLIVGFFELTEVESSILVLMHGMPIAISMIVLSERYKFYGDTITSLILISSLSATVYLNLWLVLLGH